jgi:diguanylate cyclase (GGDEF)-like protein
MAGARRVDFGDEFAMSGLRAWTFGAVVLLGVAVVVPAQLIDRSAFGNPGWTAWLLLGSLAGLALWAWWRGPRLGERSFLGVNLLAAVIGICYLALIQGPGAGADWVQALQTSMIVGTVFYLRRWHVAVHVLAIAVGTCWLTWIRWGSAGHASAAMVPALFSLFIVAVVVRRLTELARDGIDQARRGEMTDPLTGLANRRALEQMGARCWQEHADQQLPITAMVVDIDHFKRVNDTLGHAAGDALLRRTADLLQQCCRAGDVVVRLGGEEFLLLVRSACSDAEPIAERLRTMVEEQLHPTTISVGLYEARPGPADDLPATLWRAVDVADQAMYEAKNTGRNRVRIAAPTP